MEFSNSILLWTSIAGLLPVIIHLLNKEKPKPVSIPTVKFILKAVEKSAGKRKVNSLLLLAIRILILLTLSFLIAKPFFAEPKHQQNSDIYTVLIIDNSFYTSHTNSEGTQFNKIKNTALKIINELPHGAYISISDNDAPSPFTNIKDYAKNKITTLPISNNYIDIHSKIQQAITLLNTQKVKGKIFIISDLNKGAWNENYQLPENNRHKITVIPISQRKGNIFINEVFTQDASGQNITKIHANRSFYFSFLSFKQKS